MNGAVFWLWGRSALAEAVLSALHMGSGVEFRCKTLRLTLLFLRWNAITCVPCGRAFRDESTAAFYKPIKQGCYFITS